jgi:glycosyltransferase involved in cell wall biosynthesis
MEKIDGDVLYASKPQFTSFGAGLLKKLASKKPLVLDIDDWERGILTYNLDSLPLHGRLKAYAFSTVYPYYIGSFWNVAVSEKLVPLADELTVSNTFLRDKFGGTVVCHGRDTDVFSPSLFDKCSIRETYGIEKNKKIVMFLGTPRPFKGVEDLIESIRGIKDDNVTLVVVGIDESPFCIDLARHAENELGARFSGFGIQPFEKAPEFLAMADVIVVPQRNNPATRGQVPAKVFDAMAMGKPVIATAVSDLPDILHDCGWVVEPENPKKLSETIQYVLDNPEEAEESGRKAREKCIRRYSWHAMERVLSGVFGKYE